MRGYFFILVPQGRVLFYLWYLKGGRFFYFWYLKGGYFFTFGTSREGTFLFLIPHGRALIPRQCAYSGEVLTSFWETTEWSKQNFNMVFIKKWTITETGIEPMISRTHGTYHVFGRSWVWGLRYFLCPTFMSCWIIHLSHLITELNIHHLHWITPITEPVDSECSAKTKGILIYFNSNNFDSVTYSTPIS